MAVDRDKLFFYSEDPVDKIVANKVRRTINNNGVTSGHVATWQSAKVTQSIFPNPYGKKCFVRGRWSIDGGSSWNTFDSHLMYNYSITFSGSGAPPSQSSVGLKAAVSIGCSNSSVYIRTANGYHGNVNINISSNNETYSPSSLTFLVEYVLYEIS